MVPSPHYGYCRKSPLLDKSDYKMTAVPSRCSPPPSVHYLILLFSYNDCASLLTAAAGFPLFQGKAFRERAPRSSLRGARWRYQGCPAGPVPSTRWVLDRPPRCTGAVCGSRGCMPCTVQDLTPNTVPCFPQPWDHPYHSNTSFLVLALMGAP